MRERKVRFLLKIAIVGIAGLLAMASRPAQAQVLFDGTDWTQDRGNSYTNQAGTGAQLAAFIQELVNNVVAGNYPAPYRDGYNEFFTDHGFAMADPNHQITNPGAAAARWVWPFTGDLNQLSPSGVPVTTITVDNQDLTGLDPYPNPDPFAGGAVPYNAPYLWPIAGALADWARVQPLPLTSGPRQQLTPGAVGTGQTSPYYPYPAPTGTVAVPFNATGGGTVNVNMSAQMFYQQSLLSPAAGWNLPAPNVTDKTDQWRAPGQGFSFNTDSTQPYNYDYYYVVDSAAVKTIPITGGTLTIPPRYSTFPVVRGNGSTTAATTAEIDSMPNAAPDVYASIHNALVVDQQNRGSNTSPTLGPVSVWTSGGGPLYDPWIAKNGATQANTYTWDARVPVQTPGTHTDPVTGKTVPDFRYYPYNMQPGHYGVDIYSPGDGTMLDNTGYGHANVARAFVRVSWFRTVNTDGSLNWGDGKNTDAGSGGINDPINSRIFVVNLEQNGWIHLQGGGLGPATFTWDGDPRDQIVVTLYTLTPENPADPYYNGEAPIVVADAVRFTPQQMPTYLTQRDPKTSKITSQTLLTQQAPSLTRYHIMPTTAGGSPQNVNPVFTIGGYGRFLASITGTVKLAPNSATYQNAGANGAKEATVLPVTFVAREEGKAEFDQLNAPLRSYANPTDATTTPIPDPTAIGTVPVFYAIDNQNEDTLDPNISPNPIPGGTIKGSNGNTTTTTNPFFITSVQKVLWRYEGVPDSENSLVYGAGPAGTAAATGLLTSVRCRDGNVRPMLYWVTTAQNGSVGHVYALDPTGAPDPNVVDTQLNQVSYVTYPANSTTSVPVATNIFGNAVTVDTELTHNARNTSAYWIYPSYRPLLNTDPTTVPLVYQDPNFTLPAGLNRTGYPASTWPQDTAEPYLHYDGDIVNINGTLTVKSDTLVTMGGIQGSPFLLDNPNTASGGGTVAPQILVVPSLDGHIYAFDAGGRGDFGFFNANGVAQNTVTLQDSSTFLPPGTTERMWTWPHLGADTFHDPSFNSNFAAANPFSSDPAKGPFYNSLAYDAGLGGNGPALAGSGDGHLYAISLAGDQRITPHVNGQSFYAEREVWQYPSSNTSLLGPVSTPAIFKGNVYFTCNGRVYAVSENTSASPSAVSTLTWVYPPSSNPPYANANDPTTQPLLPGFNNTAPMVLDNTFIVQSPDKTGTTNPLAGTDLVYVMQGNSTIIGLSAAGGANLPISYLDQNLNQISGLVIGQTPLGSNSRNSPVGSLITSTPGYDNITTNTVNGATVSKDNPVAAFADDDGVLNAFGLIPQWDQYSNTNKTYLLPILYQNYDSFTSRSASVAVGGGDHYSLVATQAYPPTAGDYGQTTAYNLNGVSYQYDVINSQTNLTLPVNATSASNPAGAGMMFEGDEGGQMRAYGNGTSSTGGLFYGSGSTTGPYEPTPPNPGAGDVTIDLRSVDFYNVTDWNNFGLKDSAGAETPGKIYNATTKTTTPASHYAAPSTTTLPNNGIAVDWGDYIYLSAWGVYHAQLPQSKAGGSAAGYSNAPPTITVTFTIAQPGQPSKTVTANVNYLDAASAKSADPEMSLWPDDAGVTASEANQLSIFGIDLSGQFLANTNMPGQLTGTAQGVYPWVAKAKILIRPESRNTYAPGLSNVAVTARAQIRQNIYNVSTGQSEDVSGFALPMRAGQANWQGKSSSAFGPSPNARNVFNGTGQGVGQPRPLYFTNPIALTVRGTDGWNGNGAITDPNMIGWVPDVSTALNNLTALEEVLGNQNLLLNPGVQNVAATGPYKQLYLPVPMTQDGSSTDYRYALDGANNSVNGFYVMDRSNLAATSGTNLQIQVAPEQLHWFGGASSVMNPLPWETMPTDASGSIDYPAIGPNQVTITLANGSPVTNAPATLPAPNYPNGTTNPVTRQGVPAELRLSVHIPKYQPANVNYGLVNLGGGNSIGESLIDSNGATNDNIYGHGPLFTTTGEPAALNNLNTRSFPAGGYVAPFHVVAVVPGSSALNSGRLPIPPPGMAGIPGAVAAPASRDFTVGLSVPPHTSMRVQESTINLGNLPQGSGFTAATGNSAPPYYAKYPLPAVANSSVFAPSMPNAPSVWDPATNAASFFQPFTLVSESNINLVDVRVAKLSGPSTTNPKIGLPSLADFPPAGWDQSVRLTSDQVNNLSSQSLFGIPFLSPAQASAEGNIGFVSSFDHLSSLSSGSNPLLKENPLWGNIANSYVTAGGISAASAGGLKASGANVLNGWSVGLQPVPTVHKPRPGDTAGTQATIPDRSHDQDPLDTSAYQQPKIGVAVPVGQPSGTYTGQVFLFEDNTPIQWRNWLAVSQGLQSNDASIGMDHDGVLNVASAGSPIEAYTNPSFKLSVTVTEARLTNGVTPGTLPEVDLAAGGFVSLQPAVIRPLVPGNSGGGTSNMILYWTRANPATPNAPYGLSYSMLPGSYTALPTGGVLGDFGFSVTGVNSQWWSQPTAFPATDIVTLGNLFPSSPPANPTATTPPYLAGSIAPNTVKFATPATAQAINLNNPTDPESWLFWQGVVDKVGAITASAQGQQLVDSRTFYVSLNPLSGPVGTPGTNANVMSILNDPGLQKLSPKPIVLKLASGKFTYLFWYSGNTGQTSIYYNVNQDANLATNAWSKDTKLPTPAATSWQSDPVPIYRRVPTSNGMVDAIDLVFTGVLRNHTNQEALLARYQIGTNGQLTAMSLPTSTAEPMARVGNTNTYIARDAGWVLRSTAAGSQDNDPIGLTLLHSDGTTTSIIANGAVRGTYDPASALVYFNSALGGQVAVDPNAGTISFPNVAPSRNDVVLITYTPQVMRLSVGRDDAGAVPPYSEHPAQAITGNSNNPSAFLERTANPRTALQSPVVVFSNTGGGVNTAPEVDRLWAFYRKTDTSGSAAPTQANGIFLKPMRLLVRLPGPVQLTAPNNNGVQQIAALTVTGANGPYEVDWVRGRVYFTEVDEGSLVTVSYTRIDGTTDSRQYQVKWGDELSTVAPNGNFLVPDQPAAEQQLPQVTRVNEGQVTAYKDPFSDKIWVFWSSTQNGQSDLYYQTIAPQLYPVTPNR
jgi:hypothetical protein